ncbi:elongation factor G-like [Schistocerca gregaria]|uniref:elongation factor G-like n=1 Tax=Schistocerca gregaria TaxID=7010 RepID=UPI00211F05EA|nr:elongation factor G-like [Schistocerca gregaria]
MDSMDLEREKGITIQSAATFVKWKRHHINIIDTPGHVDFTIEVERALRVLDGAVLVICAVGAVQSQTYTVDRQMKRYNVPRIVFINKCDRLGADPWRAVRQLREKLKLKCAAVQVPIGLGSGMVGLVDVVSERAYVFLGENGEKVEEVEVPEKAKSLVAEKREELLSELADVDEEVMDKVLDGKAVGEDEIRAAIRRCCIANKFVPVFMGSAIKNKGVQLLLDGISDYLPCPADMETVALDVSNEEKEVKLSVDAASSLVAYPFKLKDDRFGQFTWVRVYQGTLKRGDSVSSLSLDKKVRISRLVRMHSDEIEDIDRIEAGDIAAIIGPEMPIGITLTHGAQNLVMSSMHVPDPVISFAISTKQKDQDKHLMKALRRFQSEDPTFTVVQDPETNEMLICGMGELHLEIYIERLRREYGVQLSVGRPRVAYRETITDRGDFEYLHKKQTGGQGQFAKVCGYLEPIEEEEGITKEFIDHIVGGSIPPQYVPAVMKGYEEMMQHGPLCGFPVTGVRMVVDDGAYHAVDSSELAFRIATHGAFKQGFERAGPQILEPWMVLEVTAPAEFQAVIINGITRRKGQIVETFCDEELLTIRASVSLSSMFGYSTEIRSSTQGKATFTMEYEKHQPVSKDEFSKIKEKYKECAKQFC